MGRRESARAEAGAAATNETPAWPTPMPPPAHVTPAPPLPPEPTQPVLMLEGDHTPDTNAWRSWPKYHAGHHMPFAGCETWNNRRRIAADDEAHFQRTDLQAVRLGMGGCTCRLLARAQPSPTPPPPQVDREALEDTEKFIASLSM